MGDSLFSSHVDAGSHEELLSNDPLFLRFQELTNQAIATSEEKVQLSQRMMRLMDNAIQRLSGKIDKYSDECKAIETAQMEITRAAEARSSKKKNKAETTASAVAAESAEKYCICHRVWI